MHNGKMSIVFVESSAAMGGVQFSTLYLLQRLDSGVWGTMVVCPAVGDLSGACLQSGIAVHILGLPKMRTTSFQLGRNSARVPNILAWAWNAWAILVASWRLTHFLAKVKPDLVVTKGLFPHFYGGLAARQLSIPCIWHVQDFISERWGKIYQRVFGQLSRWLPSHVIVDGAAIRRQLPHSLDRVTVIHNGVDTQVFRPDRHGLSIRREFGIPADALVIGHVGRMTPWKGQHYLLDAFAHIATVVPNVYLILVGAPVFDNNLYQRHLMTMASKRGLDNLVKFTGYRHDVPDLLAAMDVFAFTSVEKDTSPLALLSAMSSGLPIVSFDIEGVRELMKAGEHCLIVPVGRSDLLAESITQLLSDKELRLRLSKSVRRHSEAKYSLEHHVDRMEEILLKATNISQPLTDEPPNVSSEPEFDIRG